MKIKKYIYEQPETLRRIFREIPEMVQSLTPEVLKSPWERIFLIGSGTSKNALVAIEPMMTRIFQMPVLVQGPMSFMRYNPPSLFSRSFALFLSQSGTSMTTIEAVRMAQAKGAKTLVITSDKESMIAQIPGSRLIMPMGIEKVGPKTKGYTATLASLMILSISLSDALGTQKSDMNRLSREYAEFCNFLAAGMKEWDQIGAVQAKLLTTYHHIMVLGQGRHVGTALEGSLKITEMSGLSTSAFDMEEGLHGRFHGLDSKTAVLFLASSSEEDTLARSTIQVLSGLNIPCFLYTSTPISERSKSKGEDKTLIFSELKISSFFSPVVPELDLIEFIIPFQFLSLHSATELGLVPEEMKYAGLSAKLGIKILT